MITTKISSVLRITALMVVAIVFAQHSYSAAPQNQAPRHAIIGSWIETITPSGPGAPPPFKSVGVYNADGTSVFSDQGGVRLNMGQVFSSAVGSWVHLKDRTFAWTHVVLVSSLDGDLVGTAKIRGESIVNLSGDAYTSVIQITLFDTNGNPIFSGQGTATGQRIVVESLQ